MAALNRQLDVLRIVIVSANDDQILETARNDKLSLAHQTQVAGSQKWPVVGIHQSSMKGLRGFLRPTPISFGHAWPGDPDLADFACGTALQRLRIHDLDLHLIEHSTAGDRI